jgi:hypothetical protein
VVDWSDFTAEQAIRAKCIASFLSQLATALRRSISSQTLNDHWNRIIRTIHHQTALMNGRTVLIAASAITLLGALYYLNSSSNPPLNMSAPPSSQTVPGLEFKLSQISRNPPSLLVTLKNTSPDTPYTLLKWGTPLDAQALNLGLFKMVDGEGKEVVQHSIKVSRLMPPSREDLVTVAPGTEEATEVVFNKFWMPETKPATYKVKADGAFGGVWDRYGDKVADEELEAYSASPLTGRVFGTNEVDMRVE